MHKLCKGVSVIAMIVIFAIAFIITIDVVLRSTTEGMAILGTYELTEVSMVVIIFLSVAVTQIEKGHIRVEMFTDILPKGIRSVINIIIYLITTVMAAVVLYASVIKAISDTGSGASTAVLQVPIFPFSWIMVLGLLTFTLVLIFDTIDCFIKLAGHAPEEEEKKGEISEY